MDYRVTVGLGQESLEEAHLVTHAAALLEQVRLQADGLDATVDVDAVKATVRLVAVLPAADALSAGRRAVEIVQQSLQDANMPAPASIVTLEAESVPEPVRDGDVRPHPVER
jgi:hypothetical protein